MTSPREQAIEAAAKVMCESGGFNPDEIMANDGPRWRCYVPGATAAIDAYESARARLDGAKMVPKEATEERVEWSGKHLDEVCVNGGAHLEHMDDDAWFLSMRRADGSEFCVWWHGRVTLTEERPPPGFPRSGPIANRRNTAQARQRSGRR